MSLDRVFTIALAVSGAVGGLVLAVVGGFLVPVAYGPVSAGDALALLTVGPFCHLVGRAARSTWVGTIPGAVWLVVTMVLAGRRPEGDLVITGETFGMLFLLLGTVSGAVGIGTIPAAVLRDAISPNGSSEGENGR